jgi:hypothetical protein
MVRIYQSGGLLYLNGNPFKPSDVAIEFVTTGRNLRVRNSYNRTDILIDPTEVTKVFKEDGITAYVDMAEVISELPLVFANYVLTSAPVGASTSANQVLQITEAESTNTLLTTIATDTTQVISVDRSVELLQDILTESKLTNKLLSKIYNPK